MSKTLKLSVGVVAWNEESRIIAALQAILKQTVFCNARSLGFETELIVIANGCTDNTVDVTDAFFEKVRSEFPRISGVRMRIEILPEAGFVNAWNQLAHTYSQPDADFIYLVNADIAIDRPEAFERMIDELQRNSELQVVAPVGRRHMDAAKCKTLCSKLTRAFSGFTEKERVTQVRGHCLCARAAAMRSVWLPKRFPGAVDVLFKRMIRSNMAATEENPACIGVVQNAGYSFEDYNSFADVYYRRVRFFVGQTFIRTLMSHLKTMRIEQPNVNVTAYLRARDATDSSWLYRLVQLEIHVNGLFATLPSPCFHFHFWKEPAMGTGRKLARLPLAVVTFLFDVPVFLSAAWRLKTGNVSDVWKDTKNKTNNLTDSAE